MPRKEPEDAKAVTAADIERSIQALNKMAERLWVRVGKPRHKPCSMPWTHSTERWTESGLAKTGALPPSTSLRDPAVTSAKSWTWQE
ncbi:hypothetical protein PBOI14_26430 [Pseudomonas sp. Boi14]|nr:hypothetical protein PBOI14_26430 [Pseudomonas sp. Boi14]